ncbi:MAG: allantoinase, partial [Meiothermus sp.]
MFDLVVRGGTLVLEQGTVAADLAVEDGKIVQIGPELGAGREEIDARGLHVFPGLIDVHVHFNEPGHEDWEGIATGSAALAAGGGTLFFDMPLNSIPCVLDAPSFDAKLEALRAKSLTDFALWGGLTPHNLERLPELAERGAIGFKAFMSNSGLPEFPHADDHTLYRGMQAAARLGLPVAVHAESEGLTAGLAAEIRAGGG